MKTVSMICTKSPIFHFDFITPKGNLQPSKKEIIRNNKDDDDKVAT